MGKRYKIKGYRHIKYIVRVVLRDNNIIIL